MLHTMAYIQIYGVYTKMLRVRLKKNGEQKRR